MALGAVFGNHLLGCGRGLDFDVCVIGSGFAGTHLALEVARAGHRVAVIEAGSRRDAKPGEAITEESFEYRTGGQVDWPVNSGRAIAVGGTSNKWGGVVNRLRPTDFEMASRFGLAVDWPIGYDTLEPFYCRAETLVAARGFAPKTGEPPRSCAYPRQQKNYVGPDNLVHIGSPEFFGVARSRRDPGPVRLVHQEIPELEAQSNATLLAETRVARLISKDGRRVEAVQTVDREGAIREIRAELFVLAAGAVESPRLLLTSTSDHSPRGLGNNQDLVGRFFSVHPITTLLIPRSESLGISNGPHRTYALTEPLRERGLFGCSFQLKEIDERGLEWKMQPEIEPGAGNRVHLSATETDRNGNPLPILDLTYSDRDRRLLAECEQILQDEAARLASTPEPTSLRTGWRYHPAGACRMGFAATDGVVDADCRVFGIDNLFVSGACVFPTSGTSNPTLTVVALTLRLAQHLVERVL